MIPTDGPEVFTVTTPSSHNREANNSSIIILDHRFVNPQFRKDSKKVLDIETGVDLYCRT
jgi:hypothetical protein